MRQNNYRNNNFRRNFGHSLRLPDLRGGKRIF